MPRQRHPYDEQNERAFVEITDRIYDALDQIREDPSLKATKVLLARLAGVARKTLYNREWPVEKLDEIKEEREARQAAAREAESDAASGASPEEEQKRLIENLMSRNAILFSESEEKRERIEALERENQRLKKANDKLKSKLEEAKFESRKVPADGDLRLVRNAEVRDATDL